MIFVTGGCSFSAGTPPIFKTWNILLTDHFYQEGNINVHTGHDAFGNDLIARSMMFSIDQQKSLHPKEKIVALVMWSGISRKAMLTNSSSDYINKEIFRNAELELLKKEKVKRDFQQNIQVDGFPTEGPGYVYWTPDKAKDIPKLKNYYNYTNELNDWEQSTFNMLALQNFCDSRGVDLYWCAYSDVWDKVYENNIKGLYGVEWMYNLLNHDNRMCDIGMDRWSKDALGSEWHCGDYQHPGQSAHINFTDKILIPFINKRLQETQ